MTIYPKPYEELRQIRKALDMSQGEMGEALGNIKQATYSNYENGLRDMPADLLEKAKEVYRVRMGMPWTPGPTLRDLVRGSPQVYDAGAAPYVPPMQGPQGETGPFISPPTLRGFTTPLQAMDYGMEAARVVLGALRKEGWEGKRPDVEEWLIQSFADGLAAGRSRQLLEARLALAIESIRASMQDTGAE